MMFVFLNLAVKKRGWRPSLRRFIISPILDLIHGETLVRLASRFQAESRGLPALLRHADRNSMRFFC